MRVLQIERIRNRRTDREKILVGICPGMKKQYSARLLMAAVIHGAIKAKRAVSEDRTKVSCVVSK